MTPTVEERRAIARDLGLSRCDHCLELCPYCPRLLELRPDLYPVPLEPSRPDPRLVRIAACPDRGSVLPVSQQPSCGCAELTECRAGKGARPGAVTLRECLACVSEPAAP